MEIAITGATGFLGRYIVAHLLECGHVCRCWHRPESDRDGMDPGTGRLNWVEGALGDEAAARRLVEGVNAVVHAALHREGAGFRGAEGDPVEFATKNVLGTIRLIEAARAADVPRFVFISTCAVHEVICDDRPLDETHPLWPTSHYGAHKAAIEKFIHSYGLGGDYAICALRPTGIYGLAHPPQDSRWFDLVRSVVRGEAVHCEGGGKEVHAADVARAVELLLTADGVNGQAYNCYDQYVAEYDVAQMAKKFAGSKSAITGQSRQPKHQIETGKLRALGMGFGGQELLERTVHELVVVADELR